jgi:adenosine deaminase
VNSDDPAYFGGYVADNFVAAQRALGLTRQDVVRLAHHSITASFLPENAKHSRHRDIDAYAAAHAA